jgi:hypothetical protein
MDCGTRERERPSVPREREQTKEAGCGTAASPHVLALGVLALEPSTRRRSRPRVRERHGPTVYSRPLESVVLFGAGKPGSRPHHWQSTTVPGTVRNGAAGGPPTAKAFMSFA